MALILSKSAELQEFSHRTIFKVYRECLEKKTKNSSEGQFYDLFFVVENGSRRIFIVTTLKNGSIQKNMSGSRILKLMTSSGVTIVK